MSKDTDDFMKLSVPKPTKGKGDGNDYYSKLWDAAEYQTKNPKKLNVYVTRGSPLTNPDDLSLVVEVYSQVMRSRIKRGERKISRNTPMGDLCKMAGVMAAAMSEQCSESFGDNYNAAEYEKMGYEAFDALQRGLEAGVLTIATVKG